MSEVQSYLFDFQRVPLFFDNWNNQFTVAEMNASSNFQFVFSDYCPTNIEDCLSSGVLSDDVNVLATVDCSLKWENEIISVRSDATWNISTSVYPLKAVFLRCKRTGFVLGYCINVNSFEVTNKVKIEGGTILWSIEDG